MADARQERLTRNEVLFRELNEHIREAAGAQGVDDGHVFEFMCECADARCIELVPLTIAEYERVRADGARFVVAPGHVVPTLEEVVAIRPGHAVVEKRGPAGALAEQLDPRPG